jgi:hypothetical protein
MTKQNSEQDHPEGTEPAGQDAPAPMFEVLTRRSDGHETVHRFWAQDEEEALDQFRERHLPEDQVIEVNQVT